MKDSRLYADTLLGGMTLQVSTVNGTTILNPKLSEEGMHTVFSYANENGIVGKIALWQVTFRVTARRAPM